MLSGNFLSMLARREIVMGVESNFYILPTESGFRPDAVKTCELIGRLRAASYLCDPDWPTYEPSAHRCPPALKGFPNYEGFDWRIRGERGVGSLAELKKVFIDHEISDIRVRWPNSNLAKSGLNYPLSQIPDPEAYWDVELHLSADTAYHTSGIIDPFKEPIRCACGAVLESMDSPEWDFFYCARLPNECWACHKPADYSAFPAIVRDVHTGETRDELGGVTYRFCVEIECGKMIPDEGTIVLPDFRQIIEQTLQCKTRVVQDIH
jgi:hypothetical protein